jgi:hypothetical protein
VSSKAASARAAAGSAGGYAGSRGPCIAAASTQPALCQSAVGVGPVRGFSCTACWQAAHMHTCISPEPCMHWASLGVHMIQVRPAVLFATTFQISRLFLMASSDVGRQFQDRQCHGKHSASSMLAYSSGSVCIGSKGSWITQLNHTAVMHLKQNAVHRPHSIAPHVQHHLTATAPSPTPSPCSPLQV